LAIKEIIKSIDKFEIIEVVKDYSNIDRVIVVKKVK
jgi:methylase of polypeptide subunit release factors